MSSGSNIEEIISYFNHQEQNETAARKLLQAYNAHTNSDLIKVLNKQTSIINVKKQY